MLIWTDNPIANLTLAKTISALSGSDAALKIEQKYPFLPCHAESTLFISI